MINIVAFIKTNNALYTILFKFFIQIFLYFSNENRFFYLFKI